MRWLYLALVLVAVALSATFKSTTISHQNSSMLNSGEAQLQAPTSADSALLTPVASAERYNRELRSFGELADGSVEQQSSPGKFADNSEVIVIGTPKDPDDPRSLYLENSEVIVIGTPRDPDDPRSLYEDNPTVIIVGTPQDPDKPDSLYQEDPEVITIGSPRDPDDYWWLREENPDVIIVGEPKDPDDLDSLR